MLLYRYTAKANVDKLITVLSLAGGSLGILVTILIFNRKAVKSNMMSRVFIICVFIILKWCTWRDNNICFLGVF